MSEATPETRAFARRLLACEGSAAPATENDIEVAVRICEKLRRTLSTLAGVEGFCSLLERALTLARAEAPALAAVHVNADGSLSVSDAVESRDSMGVSESDVEVLLAEMLGLLTVFVGASLTLRFIQDIWPEPHSGATQSETENRP